MRTFLLFLVPLLVLLSACGKDELDTSTLNTNPLDPGYTGTPLMVLDHSTITYTEDGLGFRIDTVLTLYVRARRELFPSSTTYSIEVQDPEGGGITSSGNILGTNPGIVGQAIHHVVFGQQYCANARVVVDGTPAGWWAICQVATE